MAATRGHRPAGRTPGGAHADLGWTCAACGGRNPTGTSFCGHCGVAAANGDVVDEQRLITALFADISGFTTLADRLDTADLHRVISPVIGVLTGVAERYEGTIAKYAGDAVLVFFGAPIAVEDHAERALSCAIDMHRALVEALPRLPEEAAHLQLHVGVNTGRVIAGLAGGDVRSDYSILGDAVNVAQRLESVAPPGETYVGEMTQQLAADAFELEDLGGLTLKGKPEPVLAWRLVGDRRAAPAAPSRRTAFVGRSDEIDALRALVNRLDTSDGSLGTVLAEPGTGKSRLLAELKTHATQRGCRWLEARSISYGASVPYWPFVDLLRRTFGIRLDLDPEDAAKRLQTAFAGHHPRAATLVARLLGVPMSGLGDVESLSPEAFNRELSDALADWVAALAAETPTVLVVEDVHWVDSASADLLNRMARLLGSTRLLLILSGRPEGEPVMARLTAGIAPRRRVDLRLGPLDLAATGELVADMVGGPVTGGALAAIIERTGGNPFFTQELVRSLHDDDALVRGDDGWDLREDAVEAVPPTVEGVISARIDRLPKPVAQVLLAASVVGRRVDMALLDGVTELEGHLPRMVDALVDAGLLDRAVVDGNEVVMFHHALVVDVAYGRLVRRQRRDLHRRVAETAEVLYGSGDDVIDLLARHFYLAEAGVKAVDHLERAAARATRLYANDQAISHMRCAIELCRGMERLTSRLPRLLLGVADLEMLVAAYEDAVRDYSEVRDLNGDVGAWCGLSAVQRKWGNYADAVALADTALAQAAYVGPARARVWQERTAALLMEGRPDEAIESAHAGLADLGREDGPVAAELLLRLARAEETVGANEDAFTHAVQAVELLEKVGDLRGLALAYRIIGGIHTNFGRLEQAHDMLRRGLEVAERTGNAEELAGCLINLGLALLAMGRIDDGIDCDERAVRLFQESGNRNGEALGYSNLAEKLLARGELDRALDNCRRGLALAQLTGATVIEADAYRTLAAVLVAQARVDEATDAVRESSRLFTSVGDLANAALAESIVEGLVSNL